MLKTYLNAGLGRRTILTILAWIFIVIPVFGSDTYNILVLHSYHAGFTWTDSVQEGIESVLHADPRCGDCIIEYMDAKRHPEKILFPHFKTLFEKKLHSVLGNLELLQEDLPPGSMTGESAKDAFQAATDASQLSQLMLLFVGQGLKTLEPLNLHEFLKNMEREIEQMLPAKVECEFKLKDAEESVIKGDPRRLREALQNLIQKGSILEDLVED